MVFLFLFLLDPPKINTPQQKNISVRDSEPLMIKCHASGFPTPNITWKRLGKTIGNQALYFNSIKKRDSGVYLCEAHNQAGKDSTEITVRVDDSDDLESPTTERGKFNQCMLTPSSKWFKIRECMSSHLPDCREIGTDFFNKDELREE